MLDVSFTLARGEILALIGPNGAGKSTCFNMLNGQIAPDAGRVRLDGQDITGSHAARHLAQGRGPHLPDHRHLRIDDGPREPADGAAVPCRAEASAVRRGVPAGARCRRCLARHGGNAGQAERACAELAYGDLKRLELAVALTNAPSLLLMDEPTAGMAPRERIALMRLTADIARERQIGVLFTEHDMDIVFEHADRVMVLDRGELIAEGPPATVRVDPRVRATYLGEGLLYKAADAVMAEGTAP